MIASILIRNGRWVCSNCMMRQPITHPVSCVFCDSIFSNWENIMIKENDNDKSIYERSSE